MNARFRPWWQKIRQRRVSIIVATAILLVAVTLIIVGYWFDVTGFNGYIQVSTIHTLSGPTAGTVTRTEVYQSGKTLWDWLQLLIIPLVLAVIALLFNRATTRTEQKIAADRYKQDKEIAERRYQNDKSIALDKQREELLQTYLDRMSELLLDRQLRTSAPDSELRNVARVRTINILLQLDSRRIGYVFAFLQEAGLVSNMLDKSVVNLSGADFSKVNWSQTNIREADLSQANFHKADLIQAFLFKVNLSRAMFLQANLFQVELREVDLSESICLNSNLSEASLYKANFHKAKIENTNFSNAYLEGTNLSETNLGGTNFYRADLSGANLSKAKIENTNFNGANLRLVHFEGTDLSLANLGGADLSGAYLTGSRITEEQLNEVKSLYKAFMPDGSIHP
jgi:uncharacterized protein YjbI with pentapeptide repeats